MRIFILLFLVLFAVNLEGQIALNTNFAPAIASPLDKRMSVSTEADLANIPFSFNGLLTYVEANNGFYYYNGTEWTMLIENATVTTNWAEIVGKPSFFTAKTLANSDLSQTQSVNYQLSSLLQFSDPNNIGTFKVATKDIKFEVPVGGNLNIKINNNTGNTGMTILNTGSGNTNWGYVDYTTLRNVPTIFSTNWASVANKPTLFSGAYADLSDKPTIFPTNWASIDDKPESLGGFKLYEKIDISTTNTAVNTTLLIPIDKLDIKVLRNGIEVTNYVRTTGQRITFPYRFFPPETVEIYTK